MNSTYNQYSGNLPPEATGIATAIFGGMFLLMFVFFIAIYAYYAICLMKIARKTSTANAWLAWIPIANVILMLQIAGKPLWWIILFFIPIVNIIIGILVWMGIARAVGKPDWWGILIIIPVANLIVPGYLAFSSNERPAAPSQ